jgi:hypothetical protein
MPAEGSQPRQTAKRSWSISPNPEDGHRQPEVGNERGDDVEKPYGRRAARMPKTRAATSEIRAAGPISRTVFGKTSQMTVVTGRKLAVGEAKVALDEVAEPDEQLLVGRAIEPHVAADGVELLLRHPPVAREERIRPPGQAA